MTVTKAILCGMRNEFQCLSAVFASDHQVRIYSGDDRLNLPAIVPKTVTHMFDMGLCGGIGPSVHVPDAVIAITLSHNDHEPPRSLRSPLSNKLIAAALAAGIELKPVPYFSSGLFNMSDTLNERIAIYNRQPDRPEAMSDETRFADAFTEQRRIPLTVCRVLSDSRYEDADLPPAARGPVLKSSGDIDFAFLIKSLGLDPAQIPALIRLAEDLNLAMKRLDVLARALRPVILAV